MSVAYHIHPSLPMSHLKRKQSSSPEPESPAELGYGGFDTDNDAINRSLVNKRRRVHAIETGMAGLRLGVNNAFGGYDYNGAYIQEPDIVTPSSMSPSDWLPQQFDSMHNHAGWALSQTTEPASSAVLPSSVEEPESPPNERQQPILGGHEAEPANDIRMKGSSWYEPEKDRIVITDLDSDSEIEDSGASTPVNNVYQPAMSISAALLNHITQKANFPYRPDFAARESESVKALVLFKPLFPPSTNDSEHVQTTPVSTFADMACDIIQPSSVDDDAMDIEM